MSLISNIFNSAKQKALIPFLTANFPNRDTFLHLLHELPNYGASMIEIGIPFSDPMADGATIQATSQIAIEQGFCLSDLFNDIQAFKEKHPSIPIILMTYANPIMAGGFDLTVQSAENHGVDGMLMVDIPAHHIPPLLSHKPNLDFICLATPTTNKERLNIIEKEASGFLYYVSVKGITGTQVPKPEEVEAHLKALSPSLPTVIGFGIKTPEMAKSMAKISSGVVIGSAFIAPFLSATKDAYQQLAKTQLKFIQSIRDGM